MSLQLWFKPSPEHSSCYFKLKSEQMSLESFAEDGKWLCWLPEQRRVVTSLSDPCSQRWRYQAASWWSGAQCSCWGAWSDQCLEVDGCSSVDGLEGQNHCLESDVGCNRKPVKNLGRLKMRRAAALWTCWKSSQEWVAVVQAGDDQRLDQELRCIIYEERPDRATALMLGVQDSLSSRITLRFLSVDKGDTVKSSTVTEFLVGGF